MDNFQIEGTTNSELADNFNRQQQQSLQSQDNYKQAQVQKIQDKIDLINCALTASFKLLSILFYLLMKLLSDIYLGTFIGTVLLTSIDFWVTKNLTGRKLVGLRWWSQIIENDEEQWVFESRNPKRKPHAFNESVFWASQFISLVFWFIILIINFFSLSLFWIGLGFFTSLLSGINLCCYFKCRGQHQKKMQQISAKLGLKFGEQIF